MKPNVNKDSQLWNTFYFINEKGTGQILLLNTSMLFQQMTTMYSTSKCPHRERVHACQTLIIQYMVKVKTFDVVHIYFFIAENK